MLPLAAQMPGKHIMHFTLMPVNSLETIATETQYQASQEKKAIKHCCYNRQSVFYEK